MSTETVVSQLRSVIHDTYAWQDKVAQKIGISLPDVHQKGAEDERR